MTGELLPVRVAARELLAPDIAGFTLVREDGRPLPAFEPGAHIDVHTPGGQVRQYSLCEPVCATGQYRIGVLRDPRSRGGSASLFDGLRVGQALTIGSPRNLFPLKVGASHSLLFAGGIGITPIVCMARQLARNGAAFDLHYCGRSLRQMAFVEPLRRAPFADRVRFYADDEGGREQMDLRAAIGSPSPERHLYVCGPAGFMDHVLAAARNLGWLEPQLHREYFSPPQAAEGEHTGFELQVLGDPRVIPVAAGVTAAEALAEAGFEIPLSCAQGVCGTCITKVVEGIPDHRDSYFTDEERARNDCFTPCCSRAKSGRLVIEL